MDNILKELNQRSNFHDSVLLVLLFRIQDLNGAAFPEPGAAQTKASCLHSCLKAFSVLPACILDWSGVNEASCLLTSSVLSVSKVSPLNSFLPEHTTKVRPGHVSTTRSGQWFTYYQHVYCVGLPLSWFHHFNWKSMSHWKRIFKTQSACQICRVFTCLLLAGTSWCAYK